MKRHDDRMVHAYSPGMSLVRYDRAGKWYLEPTDPDLRRQHVTIDQAVGWAVWAMDNGTVLFGKRGGSRFDALTRAAYRRSKS